MGLRHQGSIEPLSEVATGPPQNLVGHWFDQRIPCQVPTRLEGQRPNRRLIISTSREHGYKKTRSLQNLRTSWLGCWKFSQSSPSAKHGQAWSGENQRPTTSKRSPSSPNRRPSSQTNWIRARSTSPPLKVVAANWRQSRSPCLLAPP